MPQSRPGVWSLLNIYVLVNARPALFTPGRVARRAGRGRKARLGGPWRPTGGPRGPFGGPIGRPTGLEDALEDPLGPEEQWAPMVSNCVLITQLGIKCMGCDGAGLWRVWKDLEGDVMLWVERPFYGTKLPYHSSTCGITAGARMVPQSYK